jgi:hypothetical protein
MPAQGWLFPLQGPDKRAVNVGYKTKNTHRFWQGKCFSGQPIPARRRHFLDMRKQATLERLMRSLNSFSFLQRVSQEREENGGFPPFVRDTRRKEIPMSSFQAMRRKEQCGIVLLITLMFTLIAAIGIAAFLHLTSTQILHARAESNSTKAFYTAEVGLERAARILKDDLYYTPEGMEPSWADNIFYTPTGSIKMNIQKYLNSGTPHYDDDFYPLVPETDYSLEASGRYKLTYQIDLSNVTGWTDRIWVKSTGRVYRRNATSTGYVLEARRRILALMRARDISPWNNAIFAGEGYMGEVINGNVDIRGSVHLLGTSLGTNDLAVDFSGGGNVKNNYAGIPSDLGMRMPDIQKPYGSEIVDSLEAEVRVQHGKVALSGTSRLGDPDIPGNSVRETLEGVYITDGYGGEQGERNVYSDNGKYNPYDLDEFGIKFPRLSEPYAGFDTYLNYLRSRALVISDATALSQLSNVVPGSAFTYSNEHGAISMDGNGILKISGIVVVEGDVNFRKEGPAKVIQYEGKGLLCSSSNLNFDCNLLTHSFTGYPYTDLLGVMALNQIGFNEAQTNVMGVFYAENRIVSQKQTSVTGTFFSNYFDMGIDVPSIYQVPETVGNLPDGMIGDFRVWIVKRTTWGEI